MCWLLDAELIHFFICEEEGGWNLRFFHRKVKIWYIFSLTFETQVFRLIAEGSFSPDAQLPDHMELDDFFNKCFTDTLCSELESSGSKPVDLKRVARAGVDLALYKLFRDVDTRVRIAVIARSLAWGGTLAQH